MAGKNILFVCAANKNRSITAQYWFQISKPENTYESAGSCRAACRIHKGEFVTVEQLEHADKIICMDQRNKNDLVGQFGQKYDEKLEVAGIEDLYLFMQIDLIWELVDKVKV